MRPGPDLWLDRPGARLRYRCEGQGRQPLVLIHEIGGSLESWDAVVEALDEDWRLLRYDQRGAGASSPVSAVDLDTLVDDLLALAEAGGLAGPACIAASALGCAVALRLAARHPERVAGLLLLTPALGVPPDRREPMLAIADRIQQGGPAAFLSATLDRAYPERFREPRARFEAFVARQSGTDPASFAAYWRMLATLDLAGDLERLAAPVRILTGGADLIRPPEQAARVPGARFDIVDSGHFMAAQTPGIVADAIAETARSPARSMT